MNTNTENNARRGRILIWILGGLLLLGVIASLAFLLPVLFPKQACNPPTLTLGTQQYVIKTIRQKSDGSLKVPANQDDVVFWVEGTNTNRAFALSPTVNNLTLETSLKNGDTAIFTGADCNSTTYTLSTPQRGSPDLSILLDQSVSGITIFIQQNASTAGFTVTGDLTEEVITTFNTPDMSEIQAEISLLETTTSADEKTLRVGISILNTGQLPITLSASNISLTPENGTALSLESSEPPLPKEIKAGAGETIYLTFTRPSTPTATLKIFSAEYELDGY